MMIFPWFRYRKEIKEIEKEIDQLKFDSRGVENKDPELVKIIDKLEAEKAVLKRLNSGELHF